LSSLDPRRALRWNFILGWPRPLRARRRVARVSLSINTTQSTAAE
jgi:hypothetical protein